MSATLLLLAEVFTGHLGAVSELAGSPAAMTTVVLVAAMTVLVALAVAPRAVIGLFRRGMAPAAVRRRTASTSFLDLCDPNAAGRPRPRAPSAWPRAA